jgi:clan AA aspartic protease (TIGR02281 family)
MDRDVIKKIVDERTSDENAKPILARTLEEGIETAWDRLEKQQPQCGFGQLGVCCNRCTMGPCRIDPFNEGPQRGVCGADADLIVARNILDDLVTGASMVTIPSAAAAKLGIQTDGSSPLETLVTASGVVAAHRVNLDSLQVGECTEYNIPAYVLDLPDRSGLGLLGLDYLNRFRMDLNTRSGVLTLATR